MPLQPAAGSTEVGPNRDNRRSIDKHLYRDHVSANLPFQLRAMVV